MCSKCAAGNDKMWLENKLLLDNKLGTHFSRELATHTHTQIRIRAHTHMHIHTNAHSHAHTHIPQRGRDGDMFDATRCYCILDATRAHTRIHYPRHLATHTHTHTHTHTYTHTHTHTYARAHTCAYTYTHANTLTRTYTHTRTNAIWAGDGSVQVATGGQTRADYARQLSSPLAQGGVHIWYVSYMIRVIYSFVTRTNVPWLVAFHVWYASFFCVMTHPHSKSPCRRRCAYVICVVDSFVTPTYVPWLVATHAWCDMTHPHFESRCPRRSACMVCVIHLRHDSFNMCHGP